MAEDYDVNEEEREEEAKLRKSKIYCRFIIYIMTSIYHFALGKYTYILILAFVMVLSWAWLEIALQDLDADESKLKWKSQKPWFITLFWFNSCRSELNWRQNHWRTPWTSSPSLSIICGIFVPIKIATNLRNQPIWWLLPTDSRRYWEIIAL